MPAPPAIHAVESPSRSYLPLPIDAFLPAICEALGSVGAVVLEAPPGSGKTTRVPPAVAELVGGQVWVLEPRRIAARASAARVAEERGERLGDHVGYAVRFDRKESAATRVLYVTEALLTRRIASDPYLRGIDAVVLDEFHERSLHTDVALALLAGLRRARPDLKLVVMSATLDAARIAAWLGAPRVTADGRLFPLEVEHLARPDERSIVDLAVAGIRAELNRLDRLVREGVAERHRRAILAFLPGVGEIERVAELLAGVDADVLPLHGELDAAAQDRALRPGRGDRSRVILATNVAETSLTVPDVAVVVDSGVARVTGHDPWSGLGTLELTPISRASAEQRAGRAGRTGPGRALRLYTRAQFEARPYELPPELRRADLAETRLELSCRRLREGEPVEPAWFEPPLPAAWKAAGDLLVRLGALSAEGTPTDIGRGMAALPLTPRLSRVLVEAAGAGFPEEGAALVVRLGAGGRGARGVEDPVSEAVHGRLGEPGQRERRHLLGLLGHPRSGTRPASEAVNVLKHALYDGFPDRVGRRRPASGPGAHAVVFAEGGSAELDAAVPGAGDAFVLVSGVERVGGRARVRAMTTLPEDWLLDQAQVRETLTWTGTRVDVKEQLVVGALVLEESPGRGDPAAVAALLAENVLPIAHRVFDDAERAEALVQRVRYLRRAGVWAEGEGPPELDFAGLVRAACADCASLNDLRGASLVAAAPLGDAAALVDKLAPEGVPLGNRRRAPISWPVDQDPYLSSRMQDFFGLARSPTVGRGQPLVLHLLAPNGRPVQVTTDLAGFWERHWPGIRKELMRRYPRHYWPEDPLNAEPPEPRMGRGGRG